MNQRLLLIMGVLTGIIVIALFTLKIFPPLSDNHNREVKNETPQTVSPLEHDGIKTMLNVDTVEVDNFMRNVERYPGTVRVRGVVSAVDSKQQRLALIDADEYINCQTTTCAQLTLPVQWSKEMPRIEETIVITGSVEESEGKRIFVASKLEQTAPPPKPKE